MNLTVAALQLSLRHSVLSEATSSIINDFTHWENVDARLLLIFFPLVVALKKASALRLN